MEFQVFAYYDKQLECTGKPIIEPTSVKDAAEGCMRSIVKAGPDNINNFKGKNLVHIGKYDDKVGFDLNENQFTVICDCDSIIEDIYGKYDSK